MKNTDRFKRILFSDAILLDRYRNRLWTGAGRKTSEVLKASSELSIAAVYGLSMIRSIVKRETALSPFLGL